MSAPFATTLAIVAAGRATTVAEPRAIGDRLEALPLADAAEALVLLEPALEAIRHKAAL